MISTETLDSSGIHPQRITKINSSKPPKGEYVLYWMQASVRSGYNSALEYAIIIANTLKLPLKVCFVLTADYPDAQSRHYRFLYEGLGDVSKSLYERGINFTVELGLPEKVIGKLGSKAAFVASDCGYTKIQRAWRQAVYNNIGCPAAEIEDNVVVPVEVASDKEEYAARTIRPKINSKLPEFLKPIKTIAYNKSLNKKLVKAKLPPEKDISALSSDNGQPITAFKGGETAAAQKLQEFLGNKLPHYDDRNDPNTDATSQLSPYLHFGMISPIEIAIKAKDVQGSEDFLEQLIVRRELAMNFVYYNSGYDKYEQAIPNWAKTALKNASTDKREYLYTTKQLENAQTHDPAWNAAQIQMVNTGYMAGYMRMYWGKKVIEWSKTPEQAFETLIYLNNKYELDGRDPNGYCGVAWCFGKHDRPWTKRPIFGTIRYMNYAGLKRKFDIDKYCRRWLS